MLQHELTKEDVLYMSEHFLSLLDPHSQIDQALFKESFQLFRKGNIYNTNVKDGVLFATVYDRQEVQVTLELDFVNLSECSLDGEKLCKHILAAFFYVYSSFASISDVVHQFEGRIQKNHLQIQKKKQLETPQPTVRNVSLDSVSDWLEWFEAQYTFFLSKMKKAFSHFHASLKERMIAERIVSDYYETLLKNRPKKLRTAQLYTALAGVTTIIKLHEFSTRHFINEDFIIEKLEQLISELDDELMPLLESFTKNELKLFEESIEHFDSLLHLTDGAFQYFSMLLYRIIWSKVLQHKEWITAHDRVLVEKLKVIARKQKDYTVNSFTHSLIIALIHFAYLLDADDLAFQRAEALPDGDQGTLFFLIELTYGEDQYERMARWLDYAKERFVPLLKREGEYRLKRIITDKFLHYYIMYSDAVQSDTALIRAMKQMLPYTFYTYNDYLLTTENYKGWAELQLLVGFEPETHGQQFLRKIEKADRSVLLPLYHQAVQRAIAEKNRKAYKLAVRRLKKLRTHYRQLKKVEKWETYFAFLVKKHRRLRAFQEELRKGKLIHD